ncbi:MAG: hypothetical protein OEY64_07160 [Nitrospinota bacterium]|nr:hypothetical protein [Nitrospinota bacterium]
MELVRNCSHGSDIVTYFEKRGKQIKVIKTSLTKEGRENLKKEIEGRLWYSRQLNHENKSVPATVVIDSAHYMRIEYDYLQGVKADCRKGLVPNAGILEKLVGHYASIWPYNNGESTTLHGDLSIDNVIEGDGCIRIIDWEHFRESSTFWGYDALYAIFETLWFGMRERAKPQSREIKIIKKLISILNSTSFLQRDNKDKPLMSVIGYLQNNKAMWGEQLEKCPNKLPVLLYSKEQVSLIDHMISEKDSD